MSLYLTYPCSCSLVQRPTFVRRHPALSKLPDTYTAMMDVDDDDDFYAPEESLPVSSAPKEESRSTSAQAGVKSEQRDEGLEEGEEEGEEVEEDDDSDIDIIIERKDGTKAAPPS